MSPNQYARHRGVSRFAVQQAIAYGRLTSASANLAGKRWKIDAAIADAEWEKNTRHRDGRKAAEVDVALAAPDIGDTVARVVADPEHFLRFGPHDIPVDEDGKALPPVIVAAIKMGIEARIKQLELERLRKSLVPADTLERMLEDIGRHLRDSFLGWPARIAHTCATEADPVQMEIILERAVTDILSSIVRQILEQAA